MAGHILSHYVSLCLIRVALKKLIQKTNFIGIYSVRTIIENICIEKGRISYMQFTRLLRNFNV